MDFQLFQLVEPAVVVATMLGVVFGVKLLVWGKGPIRGKRRLGGTDLARRLAEVEEHTAELASLVDHQVTQLEDIQERLDFAERMLTQPVGAKPRKPKTLGTVTPT